MRAILSGQLGRRTPEADGFVRHDLRGMDSVLRRLVTLTAEDGLSSKDQIVEIVGYSMARLSHFGRERKARSED